MTAAHRRRNGPDDPPLRFRPAATMRRRPGGDPPRRPSLAQTGASATSASSTASGPVAGRNALPAPVGRAAPERTSTDVVRIAAGTPPGHVRTAAGTDAEVAPDPRFGHLPPEWEPPARDALARLGHAVLRVPDGRGCGWCGVARSTRWDAVEQLVWRDGTAAWLCDACHRRWRWGRCHKGGAWRPMMGAQYLDLPYEQIPLDLYVKLEATTLKAYVEQHPDAVGGNDQPWEHLNHETRAT